MSKIPKKRYLVVEGSGRPQIAYENERGQVFLIAEKNDAYVSISEYELVTAANHGLAAMAQVEEAKQAPA